MKSEMTLVRSFAAVRGEMIRVCDLHRGSDRQALLTGQSKARHCLGSFRISVGHRVVVNLEPDIIVGDRAWL